MKILFITDNFPPEVNAPATRTFEHCQEWVKAGASVTVITSFPNFPQGKIYPGYKHKLKQTEILEGIRVIRVWTFMAANEGSFKRLIDFWSFMITSFLVGLFEKTDLIIATSPQFFTSLSGHFLSIIKNKPWIMEIRDLWPESIITMNKRSLGYRVFEYIEYAMYRSANHLVVVTESYKNTIINNGISKDKISVIYNSSNLDLYKPVPKNKVILDELHLVDKVIFGYIGTLGTAHNIPLYIECFHSLQDKFPQIHLLIIGDGSDRHSVADKINELKPKNVTYLKPVRKQLVPDYTSILDIGLVPLRNKDEYKKSIPSKIFELAAMNKYILLGVRGEAQGIVESYGIGSCFEPDNIESFCLAAEKIVSNNEYNKISHDVFTKFTNDFDRRIMARKMFDIFKKIL